jgi:hypothetical protein
MRLPQRELDAAISVLAQSGHETSFVFACEDRDQVGSKNRPGDRLGAIASAPMTGPGTNWIADFGWRGIVVPGYRAARS